MRKKLRTLCAARQSEQHSGAVSGAIHLHVGALKQALTRKHFDISVPESITMTKLEIL